MTEKLEALIARLEQATIKLEGYTVSSPAGGNQAQGTPQADGPALAAFDELLSGTYKEFLAHSKALGGLVQEQAALFEKAVNFERQLIGTALVSKQPDQKMLQELIKPLQDAISQITAIKDKNRQSPLFSHLSVLGDGSPALGWVLVSPTPGPYINEMKDSAQFYANRVIRDYKQSDQPHVKWVQSFLAFLTELFGYVKKWHTTGLAWNQKGKSVDPKVANMANANAAAPASTPVPAAAPEKPVAAAGLLSGLSKGTSGLRKVDKSEMTHKNPGLRSGGVVPATESQAPVSTASKAAPKGPPVLELQGNKWVVENQYNNSQVVISDTELKHVVYIYNCQNSTIKINGKVNAVTIDSCKKVGLLIDSVVSTVDAVNCQRLQVQITGKCPTAVIDKTDGFQLYLSKDCMDLELFSAKSSELNVLFPNAAGEFSEFPVSEQFKTVVKNGKLYTEVVEHKGE